MEIFPGFSSLQTVQEIQNDLRKRNIEAWKIHRRDHFYVNVQRHRVDKERKRWNLCFEFRKSRNTRRESRRDTGHFSVLETTRSGMELSLAHLKENEILQPLKMVERLEDTGHPVFKSMSALSRGILKKKNGRDTIHFNADASNTELLFRISVFTEQFRIGVNNSAWQVKKRDKKSRQESVTKGGIDKCKITRSETLGISSKAGIWKQFAGNFGTSNPCPRQFDSQGFAKTQFLRIEFRWYELQNQTWRGRRFWTDHSLCREYTLSRVNPQSRAFAAIPGGRIIGPVNEVQIVKILDQCGLENAIPSPNDRERTSHFLISGGKSRFLGEVHIPNAELRSSAELLSEFQKSIAGVVLSAFNLPWRMDWFRVDMEATKDDRLSSSHHWTLLVEIHQQVHCPSNCR